MNIIKICGNCGSRNYFTRKKCGYCGTALKAVYHNGFNKTGFDLLEWIRNISTTRLLLGVLGVIIIAVIGVVIWQFVFKTDTTRLEISGISVDYKTASSARIVWYTNKPSSSQVEYGRTTAYGMISPSYPQDDPSTTSSPGVTTHYVLLKGLSQNTTYYFRVKSRDADGNEVISTGYQTFKTSETLQFNIPD